MTGDEFETYGNSLVTRPPKDPEAHDPDTADLGKRVELWGFEPQTSCMPCDADAGLDES